VQPSVLDDTLGSCVQVDAVRLCPDPDGALLYLTREVIHLVDVGAAVQPLNQHLANVADVEVAVQGTAADEGGIASIANHEVDA
jgi:hypothetical protein